MINSPRHIGYCTNVHAGRNLAETTANLERYAVRVREIVGGDEPMPIGLWLSGRTARDLLTAPGEIERFRDWLYERGLQPFTFNGFPFGDFHSPVVKHGVYTPDWSEAARVAYTKDLINILVQLMPEEEIEGSISTLPIGWSSMATNAERIDAAAKNLVHVAGHLHALEQETGRLIHIDLEPEPGCLLQRSGDVAEFFDQWLDDAALDVRRFLRVCHDVCHAAVMYEDQAHALATYERAGLLVGKVQFSSAVRVDFDSRSDIERTAAYRRLREFHEPRYLHQTVVRADGGERLYDDLPEALEAADPARLRGEWRVHFHTPIFLDRFGPLETTQEHLVQAIILLSERAEVRHFEVETYAWEVLPSELRTRDDLSSGIARELRWAHEQMKITRP